MKIMNNIKHIGQLTALSITLFNAAAVAQDSLITRVAQEAQVLVAPQPQIPTSREQIALSFSSVVKQTAPAVVNIYTKRRVLEPGLSPLFGDPFFQQFFGEQYGILGMPRERVVSSLGSGVLVNGNGTLVTNYHVVEGAEDISAVLSDRREFAAEVVLADKQFDLAILKLKVEGQTLPSLQLDDSDKLEVGDLVLAIGNPFGVGQTVTHGIVSAQARSAVNVNDFSFFIQTDAAINPGNSGGALVDMNGRLVGIPTAIYSRSGGSNGIGFAIPSNMVKALLSGEQRDGRIVKPWLGASYQPITREIAESLNMESPRGVLVGEVFDAGPAEQAGLRPGDVIIAVGGHPVDDVQALRFRTAVSKIGEPLPVDIIRDGEKYSLKVTLSLPPDTPERDTRTLKGLHPLGDVTIANLNPALAVELNLNPMDRGVVVVKDKNKFEAGDMILSVNNQPVESAKQLDKMMEDRAAGWRIDFKRGNRMLSLRVVQ